MGETVCDRKGGTSATAQTSRDMVSKSPRATGESSGSDGVSRRARKAMTVQPLLLREAKSMNDTSVSDDAPEMTCPSCDAENIEQIRAAQPVYQCRVCSAKFREDGELVEE